MSGNEKREPLIQVQNLGKSFGNIEVLKDITVDIYKGDVVEPALAGNEQRR